MELFLNIISNYPVTQLFGIYRNYLTLQHLRFNIYRRFLISVITAEEEELLQIGSGGVSRNGNPHYALVTEAGASFAKCIRQSAEPQEILHGHPVANIHMVNGESPPKQYCI